MAVLVLAAITLVTIDARASWAGVLGHVRNGARDVLAPMERVTHSALQPIGNFLTGAVDYGSLRADNQRLRNEVASLQHQGVQAAAEQSAADQVLALQHLPFVGQIPTVTAQVISDSSSNFEESVTVGKGTDSGLAVGQPVVAAGGLVGSVAQVSAKTAVVVLLTDPTFAVGVRLDAANVGSAQGSGPGQALRVVVVTTSQTPPKLKVGQAVVTSGLSLERFPPNIPVGRVLSAQTSRGSLEPDIVLRPLADLSTLTYLQVLLWSPQ